MIRENYASVLELVRSAAVRSGRAPESVKILAVSKTRPVAMVREAFEAGLVMFGENYLQEARDKLALLDDMRSRSKWHFIGHLQRNKSRAAVNLFDCIETVESRKLLAAIDRHAADAGKVQSILVQVNIGADPAKSGLAGEEVEGFLEDCAECGNVSVDGLMTIPPFVENPEDNRMNFRKMHSLFREMRARFAGRLPLDELSMGMSRDFRVAIEEGATIVRIGTMLFGPRNVS
jgi:pyridoxal phosphate enzyme (YggS family)